MEKSSTEKKEQEEKPATDAQMRLITELQMEVNMPVLPEEYQNRTLNRQEASACVHLLKEMKVRDQALRAANEPKPLFDKIGFGMVYKLVWKACEALPTAHKPDLGTFIDRTNAEYAVFKKCQEACRQFVQDGGLK